MSFLDQTPEWRPIFVTDPPGTRRLFAFDGSLSWFDLLSLNACFRTASLLICNLVGTRFESNTDGQRIQGNVKEQREATGQTTAKPIPAGNQIKTNGRVTSSQTSNPILSSRSAHMNEISKCHHFHQTGEIPSFYFVYSILLKVDSGLFSVISSFLSFILVIRRQVVTQFFDIIVVLPVQVRSLNLLSESSNSSSSSANFP
jgi:hypothetical protein